MLITNIMLKNKFTGLGESPDVVGEFINGKLNGLGTTHTQSGQFKDDMPCGYIINDKNEITHTDDNGISTTLITILDNGDTWIGTDFGILVKADGTTSIGFFATIK
tara:strand:+ start:131 stop:448 length:318 start_codon:yes stop_codon:yes gene_type:complete